MKFIVRNKGIGAELSGGDFWKGAATGAIIAGLNHLAHVAGDGPEPKFRGERFSLSCCSGYRIFKQNSKLNALRNL